MVDEESHVVIYKVLVQKTTTGVSIFFAALVGNYHINDFSIKVF